jgi:hypothetical protein
MNIANVTVQKDLQGGTTLITHASGDVNGVQIEIQPNGTRWIPLPVFAKEYFIVDGSGHSWRALCTTAPNNDTSPGYFTAH